MATVLGMNIPSHYPTPAAALLVVIALLTACAAPATRSFPPPTDHVALEGLKIALQSESVLVSKDNFAEHAQRCVPTLGLGSASVERTRQELPTRHTVSLGHASSAHQFVLMGSTAVCMRKSIKGFPIFAADALQDTVNPQGVPPDVTQAWYQQIAGLLAAQGRAKVAYSFANGNAFEADYWVQEPGSSLHYASSFKKAGSWDAAKLDAQFSHPSMSAVGDTKRSGAARKDHPLQHRL